MKPDQIKEPTVQDVLDYIEKRGITHGQFADLIGASCSTIVHQWRKRGAIPRGNWLRVNETLSSQTEKFEELRECVDLYIGKQKVEMTVADFEAFNKWNEDLIERARLVFLDKSLWNFLVYAIPRCSKPSRE